MALRIFIAHRTVFALLLDVSFYNLEFCTCLFVFDYFLKSWFVYLLRLRFSVTCTLQWNDWNVVCMLEISLAFFVFHVSVYDKDLDPMITLNKRVKTPVRKIFPRSIVSPRLRIQGCRKLLRLCWPLQLLFISRLLWLRTHVRPNALWLWPSPKLHFRRSLRELIFSIAKIWLLAGD